MTLPDAMKAILVRRYGGPEVLEYCDRPLPVPRGRQVLVRIHAASVNPRDWLLREGRYVFRKMVRLPMIPGSDFSGVVAGLGPGADAFRISDAVFGMQRALGNMGAYAEYIAVDQSALAHKPPNVSHRQAAAVPCAGLTALQALTRDSRVGEGSKVTVIGASGGVGSYAVQIARVLGANVTGVASEANHELVRSLGASAAVDYRREHFAAVVRDQDVVFDTIGRESLATSAPALSVNGTYITTIPSAGTARQSLQAALGRLLRGGHGQRARVVLCRADGRDLETLAAWLQRGEIRSLIDSVYPLADVAGAHEKSRSWRSRGKLVLDVAPDEEAVCES